MMKISKGGEIQLAWGDGGRGGLYKLTFMLRHEEQGANHAKNVPDRRVRGRQETYALKWRRQFDNNQ